MTIKEFKELPFLRKATTVICECPQLTYEEALELLKEKEDDNDCEDKFEKLLELYNQLSLLSGISLGEALNIIQEQRSKINKLEEDAKGKLNHD
jgi:hypothetical protein